MITTKITEETVSRCLKAGVKPTEVVRPSSMVQWFVGTCIVDSLVVL
eukprot:CAMPEP_0175442644 /NCGR_PEP_ID=MMETSP0095-20121207/58253_1 /TAXON_ID=311494 /ORGANISM="Alexandrium monilatum, Strain CCMP3105" /LENGTH=46 /DNA_ID= /DNA_START= /DNA_END= /DNA_ORIENTATION=